MASSPQGYILSQVQYASDLIARAGLSDNKIADTPLELNVKSKGQLFGNLLMDPISYVLLAFFFLALFLRCFIVRLGALLLPSPPTTLF